MDAIDDHATLCILLGHLCTFPDGRAPIIAQLEGEASQFAQLLSILAFVVTAFALIAAAAT